MISEGAFMNCIKLKQVFSADDSGVCFRGDSGKYAFSGCSSLASIKISVNTYADAISTAAFDGCTGLKSVVISDGVKTVYDSAFHNCTGIQTIKIPGTVESLGGPAFAGCAGLKEVVMEDGTAPLSIKAGAFAGCSSLEKITIPKRATLEDKTFTDFDSVKTIRYTGSRAEASTAGLNKYDFYNADIYYDYKEEHEHKFVTYSYIYTDSCTEPGTKVTKCRICGEVRSEEEIPAQGHDWEVVSEKKATCKEQGTQNLKCKRCGETTTKTTPVSGHQFSGWTTTTAATVLVPAVQTRTCSVCGAKETRNYGNKLAATIKVNATKLPLKTKQKTTVLKVTGLAAGDAVASWKSSNTKVVKVSGNANGTCTIVAGSKKGKATVTVTLKSGLKKNITVSVQKSAVKTKKISGIAKSLKLKKNQTATLKASVTPLTSLQKVTYTSSNKKVATVTSKGVVKAKKKGTAVITVKSGSKKVKCKVIVK